MKTIFGAFLAIGLLWSASIASAADASLSGTVLDTDELGLGGIQVKVFVNGFIQGSGVSGAGGDYDVTFRYEELGDETIVAWFIPDEGSVPEIVVLRESAAAREAALWSPCLPRVDIGGSIGYDATIYSESAKFEALGQSDCF